MPQMESFYLGIDPSEAMNCEAFCNPSGEDEINSDNFKLLDQRYNKYCNSLYSEVNYCTSLTDKNEKVNTLENQLLTFEKSIVM